jgi:hypothetical protein
MLTNIIDSLTLSITSLDIGRYLIELLTGYAIKTGEDLTAVLTSPERRQKLLKVLWIICVVLALMVTAISLGVSHWLGVPKGGVGFVVVLWAILLGATALLFLSSKVVTAVFGGLVGVSLSDVASPAGVVERANVGIAALASQVGAIGGPATPDMSNSIASMLWLFIVAFALSCLPAFFAE